MREVSIFVPKDEDETKGLGEKCVSTPSSTRRQVLHHKLSLEDKNFDVTWKSCCLGTTDKRLVTFSTQISIIVGMMLFSIYQLVVNDTCEHQQAYIGLLTLLLGLIIPSPTASVFQKK